MLTEQSARPTTRVETDKEQFDRLFTPKPWEYTITPEQTRYLLRHNMYEAWLLAFDRNSSHEAIMADFRRMMLASDSGVFPRDPDDED